MELSSSKRMKFWTTQSSKEKLIKMFLIKSKLIKVPPSEKSADLHKFKFKGAKNDEYDNWGKTLQTALIFTRSSKIPVI